MLVRYHHFFDEPLIKNWLDSIMRISIFHWFIFLLIGATAILFAFVARTILWTGDFRHIRSDSVMSCLPIEDVAGVEDMVVDRSAQKIYTSSCNRTEDNQTNSTINNLLHCRTKQGKIGRGAIYAIDISALNAPKRDITLGVPSDFHPYGIDFYQTPDGEKFVFVVNHAVAGERVEIYRVEKNGDLKHLETAMDPLFINPNDLTALGSRSFYVSNDGRYKEGSNSQFLEHLFRKNFGNIVLWEAGRSRIVDEGYSFANGVALSHDRNSLYILESVDRRLSVASLKTSSADFSFSSENSAIIFDTSPDNVTVDHEGLLWVAGHPKGLQFKKYQKDPERNLSPTQIFVLDALSLKNGRVKGGVVHSSAGDDISAASVAVRSGQRVFIGAPYENHILACQLNPVWKPWERVRVPR